MGAQVLHAILCWAVLGRVSGQQQLVNVNNSVTKDSSSAASGLHTRLYHNVRVGNYASPYGAYSYSAPMATSQVNIQSYPQAVLQRGPVQNQQLALHSVPQASIQTPVFKDSYGKFVQPQMAYNMNPQFVQIQALPAHLTQPLANSPIQYQYKTAAPHFFVGPQFKIPDFKPISTSATNFANQPQLYSHTVNSAAPASTYYSYGASLPATYEASTAAAPAPTTTTEIPTTETQVREEVSESQTLHDQFREQNSPNQDQSQEQNSQSQDQFQEQNSQSHQGQFYEQKSPTLQEQFRKQKSKVYKLLKSKYGDAKSQESKIDNQKTQTQTRITAIVNGEPTTVTLNTKPVLPLLDISLLEPLTFDTPLVTQMQHFLPKIEQASYHKLPEFELDNDENDHKSQQKVIVEHVFENKEKKQKKPKKHEFKPSKGAHVGPEISYEIKTPNGKEVYKEQVISYNKVLKPEPQHFSYDSKNKKEPEVYSYVHNSQEPLAVTRVNYHSQNNGPKHVFTSAEDGEANNDERSEPQSYHHESDHSDESSAESIDDRPIQVENDSNEPRRPITYQHKPSQEFKSDNDEEDSSEESQTHSNLREKPKYKFKQKEGFRPKQINYKEDVKYGKQKQTPPKPNANYKNLHSTVQHNHPKIQIESHKHSKIPKASQFHAEHKPVHRDSKLKPTKKVNPKTQVVSVQPVPLPYFTNQPVKAFVPVIPEFAENMRLLSHSAIKVDPYQHVQYGPTTPRIIKVEHPVKGKLKNAPTIKPYILPQTHVHEKSKRIIIKDESPQELHMHAEAERIMQQMIGQEENNEEDFEKAYKEAAFGFPGYNSEDEIEKDVFDPESYGVPHEHLEYNIKDNPFKKYEKKGDKLPKAARLSYRDAAENTKEDYYLDYAVSKPESFLDHHKHKANYFKMYQKQRPEKIFTIVPSDDKKHKPEKFVAATAVPVPSYIKPKPKQFLMRHGKPMKLEFDYSKSGFHDNTAFHAFPAHYRFKSSIEPFQFGSFDHLRPLIHIDSELAAVASNNSAKSEKPARKKLYKEQWYIKKTTTGGKNR